MRKNAAARTTHRQTIRLTFAGLIVITAGIVGTFVFHSALSSVPSIGGALRGGHDETATQDAGGTDRRGAPGGPGGELDAAAIEDDGALTKDDGLLPDGVTVFENQYPGIANLDPDLLQAIREAATEAAYDGIEFSVNSGWRSPEYQNQLLLEAVAEHGSEAEAARWVATADTSPHVSGDAIDIGPFKATAWLAEHGAAYGLCQIYGNEPWHYELRPEAIDIGCPPMFADPTHDPRMQQ